jgi:hypothetical protein|tara:strand:+ start:562 stop:777 length:216 start_codon:yes stop_codon:yes gene_type:complete
MKLEEFEKSIRERGYGIAAMNHYSLDSVDFTYCVILNKSKDRAFQSQAEKSEDVFESIYDQMIDFERENAR